MKHLFCLVFSFLIIFNTFGQANTPATDKTIHSDKNWFTYFGHYKLSDKWGIHADAQFRMDEDVKYSNQNLLRTGLVRYLTPAMNLTAGYAYITTQNVPLNAYFTEHRIWEQFIFNQSFKPNLNMTHRLRLEQRFVETLKIKDFLVTSDGYLTGNRIRYFNRTVFDIPKQNPAVSNFYIALQDEVFITFASDVINPNAFDRNRFLFALGILHDKKNRMEIGYMNQFVNGGKVQNAMNHILHFSVLQSLNFMKPAN